MSAPRDLGLSIPLHGLQLIEASAGTGKTFTLATLYARLVIEQRLPVAQILAVTFTEAATKELRERLRERLLVALACLEGAIEHTDAAAASTRELLESAIALEGRAALRQRLRFAAAAMDLAPIHTIHAFCRRALADHALEAGQPLVERTLIENEAELRSEVANDFWRLRSRDVMLARRLRSIWKAPSALADSLRGLLATEVLLPESRLDDGSADAALELHRARLAQAMEEHGETAFDLIRDALAAKILNGNRIRIKTVETVWAELRSWVQADITTDPLVTPEKLGKYTPEHLALCTSKGQTPTSPLFEAIAQWLAAREFYDEVDQERRIALIHDAVVFARERLATIKYERGLLGYDDMIRGVADALDSPQGDEFAAKLQAQYRVALLDEFQDTDGRQWAIFRRLFGPPYDNDMQRALFLIGDPKQAIYRFRGGDVFTYLAAARSAGPDQRHTLTQNFRSRPAMLAAVQALFDLAGPDAFAQDDIEFIPVTPGGFSDDADLRRGDVILPALTFLVFDAQKDIEASREVAAGACVAAIRDLLVAGAAGAITRRDKHGLVRGVLPGDIAILVERHHDGERMQRALSLAGIPSVAAGRQSLYDTDEARHVRWLLAALNEPGDDSRLRAALASPLFGLDAQAIAALDSDDDGHRAWQDRLQQWRERAERHGPLALINDLAADNAPRLLLLRDGERRLTNYLQLAEALQDAEAHALGLGGLADELDRRIADADAGNDSELLRLESDADRVKILTLHKSKGLEFDLVFLPFAATGGNNSHASRPPMATCHDHGQRVTHLYPAKNGDELKKEADEDHAEDLRLLYVGLTRARLATWVACGPAKEFEKTALAALLQGHATAGRLDKLDADALTTRLAALRVQADVLGNARALAIVAAPLLPRSGIVLSPVKESVPPAAIAQRLLSRDWWIYSFSQLAREDDGATERGASDEVETPTVAPPSRFSGARFGNSLHTALELVDMAAWRDWQVALPPEHQFDVIVRALREQGYTSEADIAEGVPLLTALVANTLNVRLPEGARLAFLPTQSRRAEMEFHLALIPTAVSELLALLHAHGLVSARQAFGHRRQLEGLLTGFIDLIYEFDGRYYVLDYKSNQLRDYASATLAQAVRDSEYDLQYLIYTLALHRWLRFRLGTAYDPASHLGGVRYLFCRGLDAFDPDSPGIHALSLPVSLVEALDRLFTPPDGARA